MGGCNSTNKGNLLSNQSVMMDMHKDIKNKFEKHIDVSSQKVVNIQDLKIIDEIPSETWNIKEGEENIFASKIPTYKWFGLVKTGEISEFGCNYDISQESNIEISSIKKDIMNDKTIVLSTIKNKIKKKVNANISNQDERSQMNDAIDFSDNELLAMIESKIETFSENQELNMETQTVSYKTPIKCDLYGKGPTLSQSADLDVLIHDIINESVNIINKNISKKGLKSKLKTNDNSDCTMQIAVGVFLLIILIIFISMIVL